MASPRSSPTMVPSTSMEAENTQLTEIEQPHKHDVLSGRGVTTNKYVSIVCESWASLLVKPVVQLRSLLCIVSLSTWSMKLTPFSFDAK